MPLPRYGAGSGFPVAQASACVCSEFESPKCTQANACATKALLPLRRLDLVLRRDDNVLGSEAEVFQKRRKRRGSPKAVHSDAVARGAYVERPAKCGCHFDGNARLHARRQHGVSVRLLLPLES